MTETELATLRERLDGVVRRVDENRAAESEEHRQFDKRIDELSAELDSRLDRIATRLWQFFGITVVPIVVAVVIKVVLGP